MRIKIQNFWYRLRSSFLFLPTLLAIGAIVLSFITTAVDSSGIFLESPPRWWLYSGGANGARSVLSVITGSMITVAGVVFSITIVVLSLASSQFGPRLIRNFMNVRANQLVLGIFVATFTYGILVLRSVNDSASASFIPGISVTIAILTALFSLGVLIYFIHSVSESIQAQNIIARVCRDLDDAVKRIFPEKLGDEESFSSEVPAREYDITDKCDREACQVIAVESGYFQAIDNEALMRIAVDDDLLIHLGHRPGDFITRGCVLVTIWPGNKVDTEISQKINDVIILGTERTLEQDVEYAISQMTEIAVRALSSGVNDPITAIACIDWLGASLCQLAGRKMPSSHRYDQDNRLRIICKTYTFAALVDAAFNMIRQNSQTVASVSIHLLETIATVMAQARKKDDRAALMRQAVLVADGCKQNLSADDDRADLEARLDAVSSAFKRNAPHLPREKKPVS